MSSFQTLPNEIITKISINHLSINYKDIITFSLSCSYIYRLLNDNDKTNVWSFLINRDLMPGVKWNMNFSLSKIYLTNIKIKPKIPIQIIRWAAPNGYTGLLEDALLKYKPDGFDECLVQTLESCGISGSYGFFCFVMEILEKKVSVIECPVVILTI